MAERKMIKIASRLPMAVSLIGPPADPERPGVGPAPVAFTVPGAGHPGQDTVASVDAEAFAAWKKGNPDHDWLANGLVREVDDDYEPGEIEFGHEPALERLTKDRANNKLAGEGSGETEEAPLSSDAMAANSDEPNDDSPRSQVGDNPSAPRRPGRPARV
ncbi:MULTISPECIES: hypothetical protein [Methylobacterium]|uniref:Uncharacterized protein n=1 Tax=Methylobacterium jeotgali TaxID=381630 RepID=A0ABQ4SZX6_9HYPH|nr:MULTISPECIES: hypothetical protein [Methylobacterium]PIU06917.1 MAG: hypothetical protein COT56_07230 [Methylobacterium sp. CG09_land_8_20_14_0_10_71_15]PIU16129.1 MAG: hypothetical protein COT28_01550 [Methylobacterium sp. CG08_land_8_20_14_0_20_71_15]GBU18031.1 hypothetical protein AwMethylo_22460 [Methylobacterium sp.]GJE08637.1 hypothetical protein AOPFMNJM_3980 [Methylobacterium jeotgali]